MSTPGPDTVKRLEGELRECFDRENYVEALDIYDEIQSALGGRLRPQHLVGKGQCLLKLRRKQDAKKVLLTAFEADANFQPAIHMLDQNFPGWEKTYVAPPPEPVAGSRAVVQPIVVQAPVAYAPAPPPQQYHAAPPPAQHHAAPPPAPYAHPAPPAPSGPHQVVVVQQAPPPAAPSVAPSGTYEHVSRINWNYVAEDVEAALLEAAR